MEFRGYSIKQWSEDDRPREKMLLKGRNSLSDAELLAILIGTGTGSKSAVDLGRELLGLTQGDLNAFGKLRVAQLCQVKGIGNSKAISILAALELGRRRKEQDPVRKTKMNASNQVYEVFWPYFADLTHEEFYCMYLDRANNLVAVRQISVGGLEGTYVDAKVIYKHGLDLSASSLILAHNHPSGNLKPSHNDIQLTKRIREFGTMIEMPVLDHLIVTDNGYFSFADNGVL